MAVNITLFNSRCCFPPYMLRFLKQTHATLFMSTSLAPSFIFIFFWTTRADDTRITYRFRAFRSRETLRYHPFFRCYAVLSVSRWPENDLDIQKSLIPSCVQPSTDNQQESMPILQVHNLEALNLNVTASFRMIRSLIQSSVVRPITKIVFRAGSVRHDMTGRDLLICEESHYCSTWR
jgi:hypothetical protein